MSRVCQVCHTACSDETKYCPNCGTKLPAPNTRPHCMYEDNSHPHSTMGPEIPERPYKWSDDTHPHSTVSTVNAWDDQGKKATYNVTTDRPMKWYKFLIYVSLFLTGIANIGNGIRTMEGMIYDDAYTVYSMFPSLASVDRYYGYALIALGVFAFFVRSRLAKFRRNGPSCLYFMIIGSIILQVVYFALCASILAPYGGLPMENFADIVGIVVGNLIYLVLNKVYFDKRMHLFVNM